MRSPTVALVFLVVLVFAHPLGGAAEDLRQIWTARTNSVEQLAAAINEQFTNGTPMREVVAVLGRQDTMYITTTMHEPLETQNQRVWVYWFGPKEILVTSSGGATTPLSDRGFAGAEVVARDNPSQQSREPQLTLPERVAASNLIVLGRFGPPGNTGMLTTTSVKVDEVLRGSVPSGKTLWVSYSGSRWLIPEVAAYPGPVAPHGSQWILFLTDTDVQQAPGTNYYTRAVGPHKWAHDGFELAKDEMVKQVRNLLAEESK